MVIEQYIGNYSVPTDGVDSIPLTKSAYSIDKPAERRSDFSKSIKIPETKETNKLFEHIFEYSSALQTFNPNLKTSYKLIGDGVTLLSGFCQLVDVSITDGKIYYILQAKGVLGDLYQAIGQNKLTDLDFSSMDHNWTKAEIENSWTDPVGEAYVYPMINYGDKINQNVWNVQDFKPAIYLKQYIDKIFAAAGYTYSSDFFDSDFFKRLIIPQSSDTIKLSESSIQDRQFLVSRTLTDQTAIGSALISDPDNQGVLIFNNDLPPIFYNTSTSAMNTTTGLWTVASGQGGTFAIKAYLKLSFTAAGISTSTINFLDSLMNSLTSCVYNIAIVRERAGVKTVVDVQTIDILAEMTGETWSASYTSPDFEGAFTSADIDFADGDIISLRVAQIDLRTANIYIPIYGQNVGTTAVQHTLDIGSEFGVVTRNTNILPGGAMIMNDTIQKEVLQKDLLNAIIKRFNMYIEVDELNEKNIFIEPLEDFMTQDKEDLSSLVDVSKEIIVKPLGALESGSFLFKDQEDTDNENSAYQSRKSDTYGAKLQTIENDFLTEEKVIDTIFAPCPLWAAVRENDRIISSIAFPRDLGGYAKETAKLKLLYWGGELATKTQWFIKDGLSVYIMPLFYPYAGHLDDPFDPTFDLCWTVPKILFYDFSGGGRADLVYTDNNCYNVYWSKHINEISDKDSKILIVYLNLNAHRYNRLSFRKLYFIDGVFWRLLEVSDFDPQKNETTKCKFIKLKDYSSFSGTTETVYGGSGGEFVGGDFYPGYGTMKGLAGGSGYNQGNLMFGDNIQSGRQSIINSDDFVGGSGSGQVLVSGSDGAKVFTRQAVVLNSPGQEVSRPGMAFVNNVSLEIRLDFDFSLTQVKSLNTNPITIISGLKDNEYIKITRAYIRMTAGTSALTSGSALEVRSAPGLSPLASTSGTFFDGTSDKTEILTLSPELLNFGEGVELYQSADMEGGDGTTAVSLVLIYQIIEF